MTNCISSSREGGSTRTLFSLGLAGSGSKVGPQGDPNPSYFIDYFNCQELLRSTIWYVFPNGIQDMLPDQYLTQGHRPYHERLSHQDQDHSDLRLHDRARRINVH